MRMRYRGKLPMGPYQNISSNAMPLLVNAYEEVVASARRYILELSNDEYLIRVIPNVQHWYYIKIEDKYVFAPSKFIGYLNNTGQLYYEYTGNGMDGRETERVLRNWFKPVEQGSKLEEELMGKLEEFTRVYDKKVNKRAIIHVLK